MSDAFDITAARLAWIPLEFAGLISTGDELAKPVTHRIELQVDLIDLEEFARLFESPRDRDTGEPLPGVTPERLAEWDNMMDADRAVRIIKDWRKVKANGVNLPFTEENLRKLFKVPNVGLAFFTRAFVEAYRGVAETREGN